MSDLLALDRVSVAYGKRRALESVSLTIGSGEIVTLLGANGSGKSTTLRTISGLVRSHMGRIVFDGRDITRAAPDAIVAAGVGHVPEGREIFPQFTCTRTCSWAAIRCRTRASPRRRSARSRSSHPPRARAPARGTLSGGEQQMLAIARALMSRPRLILLDEPSLGLAPRLTREIFGVIGRISAEGVTVLLVEQNARRALALASRAYVLETGRVVVSGPARELAADPRIRAAYLGLAGPRRLRAAPPRLTRSDRWRSSPRMDSRSQRRARPSRRRHDGALPRHRHREPVLFLHSYGPGTTAWITFHKTVGALSQHFRCILMTAQFQQDRTDCLQGGRPRRASADRCRTPGRAGHPAGALRRQLAGGQSSMVAAITYPGRVNKFVMGGSHIGTGGDRY